MGARPATGHGARPLPQCPRKPLHLASAVPISVSAAGASLVVRREPNGSRQFPLARIERVICNRNAQWTGEALMLCLAHDISLTWVDGRGRAVGDATPVRAAHSAFAERIERYLERPQWAACYATWLRRRRMAVVQRWAARQGAAGHPPDDRAFESLKRAYVYRAEAPAFDEQGAGWCQALTVEQLGRDGLHKRYWGHGGQALELCADLSDLLSAQFALACGALPASTRVPAVKLLFFEGWADEGRRGLIEHLGDLKRHVAREIH